MPTQVLDFDFDRDSIQTFRNADGLLEVAPVNFPAYEFDEQGNPLGIAGCSEATNLLLRSEEFDNAYWTKIRATITANATTSPDGTLTADKLVEDTTANNNHIVQISLSGLANTNHTLSVFAKAQERVRIGINTTGVAPAIFDLQNGQVVTLGGVLFANIKDLGNGWYRCSVTSQAIGTTDFYTIFLVQSGTTTSYTGDGTSGLFIWGAQLEVGSVATSYIPTTSATVTRKKWKITRDNATDILGQVQGFFGISFIAPSADTFYLLDTEINVVEGLNYLELVYSPTSYSVFLNNTLVETVEDTYDWSGMDEIQLFHFNGEFQPEEGYYLRFFGATKSATQRLSLNGV